MANKISIELLMMILNNVQSPRSTQDLFSSLLVNRIWCRVTIPILWELPFGQECTMDDTKLRKRALCIRTYISCMDTQARTLLTQNGYDLSSSPPQAAFDYPSFAHKFGTDNLIYFISVYSQQIIGSDQDNDNDDYNNKSRILFREICKLILNRCSFLDYFKLAGVSKIFFRNFSNYSDLIGLIPKLPDTPKVLKKLETFVLVKVNDDELIKPLYESLALICDDILNMDLQFISHQYPQLLPEFISAQKRLENLSIAHSELPIPMFCAIISQKETLESLRLKSVNFHQLEGESSPTGEFVSLQKLYIANCTGLDNSNCLSLASSFTQLSNFHCYHSLYNSISYPQEFIIKILETANANLKHIFLNLYLPIPSDIFTAILNSCTMVTKLTLHDISIEQVIAIFNNNFNELTRFSFDYNGLDANKLLCQMAESVPVSLETLVIRMGIFNADSLRKFFEGWCCEGGAGNKKIIVKRTEQARLFKLSDEHLEVIEEYGIPNQLLQTHNSS
ncbi:9786_t:CDS:2 [Diversispora eburnea]|uniref:9786_t:CDS:1 n=1 Tax=Diversispora eburnea TaxID=1213867 RepID=A0A9N9B0G5_9GLOM|nr:9786_t:CDS:2 [Diversispora eburnea]